MSNRLLLLGHRGSRGNDAPPENTPAAFDLALAHGCDGFEFDVRLSMGGEAIVCHDARVRAQEISKSTRSDLASLCTLEDVLVEYGAKAFLDIELKVSGLANRVISGIQKKPPRRGYVISSFLPAVITEVHGFLPDAPLGLICETGQQLAHWTELPVDYVIPHFLLVSQSLVQQVQQHGKQVLVWTVNSSAEMQVLMRRGVDGIISDDTALLVKTIRAETQVT